MIVSYTHPFSLFINIALLAPTGLAVIFVAGYLDSFYRLDGVWFYVYLVVGFFVVRRVYWFLQKKIGSPLGTFLYCRYTLGADVSWSDCRIIYPFFSYNSEGIWHPMTHVKSLPKELRREAIFMGLRQTNKIQK